MKFGRHLFALFSMVCGSALVFGGVLAMNLFSKPPEKDVLKDAAVFSVEKKPPPPKPRQEREQIQRRRAAPVARASAPAPDVGAQLSGLSFGLPSFETDLSGIGTQSILGNAAKDLVMTEDAVDQPAQPTTRVPPEYPKRAREKGIEGYVTLNILVSAQGSVQRTQVLNAEPPGVFEEYAKTAIAAWEFKPGQYQGGPVAMWVKQTMRFKLN